MFRTSPRLGTPVIGRVWVIGDSGSGTDDQRNVTRAFMHLASEEQRHADLMLALGDNAYDTGKEAEYQRTFFHAYGVMLHSTPVWPALGNHDALSSRPQNETGPYFTSFTLPKRGEAGGAPSHRAAYYSFNYGDVHFVVLDSSGSSLTRMERWLDADRAWCEHATNRARDAGEPLPCQWLVAVVHHAPYSKGSEDSDTHKDQRLVRERLIPALERAGVDIVLSGHSHSYERSYLIHNHHGSNETWDASTMVVDGGDGDPSDGGDGAYVKPAGLTPFAGFVSVVAGSSGKITAHHGLSHPAMRVFHNASAPADAPPQRGLFECGSVVLDLNTRDGHLDVRFLTSSGEVHDHFRISKTESTQVAIK
jgi:hypothetical protein